MAQRAAGEAFYKNAPSAAPTVRPLIYDPENYPENALIGTTPSAIRSGEPLWCADCKSYHPIGLHTDTPSDAPTADEHKCGYICNHCKQHFPGYAQYWRHKCKPTTSKVDENERDLEVLSAMRERDEARAELAKLKMPPPTEGSAVEWVRENLGIAGSGTTKYYALDEHDALDLARRADEAETERDAAIQLIKELNATKYQHGRQYRSRCGQFLSTINRNKQ